MRLYRVHLTIEAGTSAGFEHFTSKRAAETAARLWRMAAAAAS
jgi:hypothetical protein